MTTQPPNPDPGRTPDLEAGGGVAPGSTPPAAAQTSGGVEPQPSSRGRFTPTGVVTLIAVVVIALIFVATAVYLILKIFGAAG
ncbi:DUF6480 family protein [Mycobacterium sherrisii]|uniref:DUF6480 family protein n=1 Tax=Mycobacterium sherrisii TaxID=243061 RepID=UPI000A1647BE|nr:DUF6480 family protein [Mycobacterium sherrisii]MCV7031415.1 hypothetical protein [Mycobacterium sherrisii]ORW71916.1 hypothetical protein AWC25_19565 [Mycobacterium sherrisii]